MLQALLISLLMGWLRPPKPVPAPVPEELSVPAEEGVALPDSTVLAALDSMVIRYVEAIRTLDTDAKEAEVDFMIGSCSDSAARQRVALKLYGLYLDSPVMGEEAVAIHIFDRWFASGEVRMGSEVDLMNARIFVDFNRSTLLGMDAPLLELQNSDGQTERLPIKGRSCILWFYDTGCSNCKLQGTLLPYVLENPGFKLDFYAIYTGADKAAWSSYISENLLFTSPEVTVHHLWDPDIDSDYQRLYGVLSTPKMYMTEPQGTLIGRRLDPESLKQMLVYAGVLQNLYDKHLK